MFQVIFPEFVLLFVMDFENRSNRSAEFMVIEEFCSDDET